MSGFSNPLVGGGGSLVYPSIHSPNYVPGVSGWSIRKDGSAEFDNLTFRGTFNGTDFIINAAGVFFYSGTPALGNLIFSDTSAAGTDQFGNVYQAGTVSYSATNGYVQLNNGEVVTGGGTPSQITISLETITGSGQLILSSGIVAGGPVPAGLKAFSALANPVWCFAPNSLPVPVTSALVEIQGLMQTLTEVVQSGSATGGLVQVTNTTSSPSTPAIGWSGKAAGDAILGIDVTGDTNNRFKINTNGDLRWGSGAAALDTLLHRTGGQLAVSNAAGLAGNMEIGQPANGSGLTVTTATLNNLATMAIPAGDAAANAVYRLTAFGSGTWGSTQQALTFQITLGGVSLGSITIAAAAFAASASFRWKAEVVATCLTTGAAGTWVGVVSGMINETGGGAINPGTAATNTLPFAASAPAGGTVSTVSANTLALQASWAATLGIPTISSANFFAERVN